MATQRDTELLARIGMTPGEADDRAAEYEADAWNASTFDAPRPGRPSISDGPVKIYSMRFPVELMAYVEEQAAVHGNSRSEELREIVARDRDLATA